VAEFSVNAARHDPYKRHAFRVRWDRTFVVGISRVGPLGWLLTPADRDDSDFGANLPQPPAVRYVPVQLERSRTHDTAFEKWAALVSEGRAASRAVKDVEVQLLNEAGQLAMTFLLGGCTPIEYVALSAMDANADGIAVETLTLAYRSLGRDMEVGEPTEH
jgi:phage tail-like protein